MPQKIIELLKKGRQANHADKYRKAGLVSLPAAGDLILTGDIHGHRRNFQRICAFADLANNPERHVVFQEVIHGGPEDEHGGCLSFELLFDLVRYKLEFPDRVHIVMGNHDTAIINQSEVMKNGKEMNVAMYSALKRQFGESTDDLELALRQFLFSQPLAVRCQNRIWFSHSLPDNRYIDKFDHQIFFRELKINEVVRPNSAYLLTWGRRHSAKTLDKLAELLDVDIFILGHQPQEQGFRKVAENLLIIASDHNHGVLLPIDLKKDYTIEQLLENIVLLGSIC